MKKNIKKSIIQRYIFKQNEIERLVLKSIKTNHLLSNKKFYKTKQLFFYLNNISSSSKIKNRCILTGRSHSINRFFKISRIKLRDLASKGLLPGFSKYSW